MTTTSELVVLRGGWTVPAEALRLAWELEGRGLRLTVEGNDLVVGPRSLLTEDDRAAIRAHKYGLLKVVRYVDAALYEDRQ